MTAAEKVTKAKVQLILSQPFFATLMLSMKVVEDQGIKMMAVNGEEIKYNPAFVDMKTVDELKGLICSAILKVANLHHLRRGGRNAEQWNLASEYAVNPLVKDAGMKLPKESLINRQYNNLAAEMIFTKLGQGKEKDPNSQNKGQGDHQQRQQGNSPTNGQQPPNGQQNAPQQQPQQQQQQQPEAAVEVQDAPINNESDRQQKEAEIKQRVAQAAQIGKKAGNMPGFLEEMIREVLEPKIHWQEVLARFVSDIARNDYSFSRPNARFIHTGFYLPSLYSLEVGRIIFIIDASSSIDLDLFKQFAGELKDVSSDIKCPITMMYVSTKVIGEPIEIEPDDEITFSKFGGGTDFRPGFELIAEKGMEAKAIIYLTDGECHSYPEEPEIPTLWVQYGGYRGFKPPFGEVIKID